LGNLLKNAGADPGGRGTSGARALYLQKIFEIGREFAKIGKIFKLTVNFM
jgi:hypothetical protein